MSTLFTKIINKEIPSYKIAEDKDCYAFLDINPLQVGHTLVVPKIEIDYLFDLENETLGKLMEFSKKIANAIKKTIDCERIGVSVIGLEVPHAHIHLIPIKGMNDMNFSKERVKLTNEEFIVLAKKINSNINEFF